MKKSLYLLLSVALLLSGCGSQEAAVEFALTPEPEYKYTAAGTALPEAFSVCTFGVQTEHGLYLAGRDQNGVPIHGVLSGSAFVPFCPAETEQIYTACDTGSGFAVLCGGKSVSVSDWLMKHLEGTEVQVSLEILETDYSGHLVRRIPLEGELLSIGAEFTQMCYRDGSYYLMSRNQLVKLSGDGEQLFGFNMYDGLVNNEQQGAYAGMAKIGEEIYICTVSASGASDEAQGLFGRMAVCRLRDGEPIFEPIYRDSDLYPLGMGLDVRGDILLFDENALYKLAPGADRLEEVFSWLDAGVYSVYFNSVSSTEDKSFVFSGEQMNKLTMVSYGANSEERTRITLMCRSTGGILAALVEEFNAVNPNYYITIETGNFDTAGMVDLASGNAPDLYCFFGEDLDMYVKEDSLFEDLSPWFEGKQLLTPSVQRSMERDGRLYILPFDYLLWTFRTPVRLENTGTYNAAELQRLLREIYPDANMFQPSWRPSDLWSAMCPLCVSAFVDTETGSCSFDSPQYAELLEACTVLPKTPTSDWDENTLLAYEQVGTILRASALDRLYGDNYTLVGCPTAGLSGGSAFEIQNSFAVSCSSENKAGAWEFLQFALSAPLVNNRDISATICLPASQAQLSAMVSAALGDGYSMYNFTKDEYRSITMSQYSADQLIGAIARTDSTMNAFPDVQKIMKAEAEKFFAGDISAAQAASNTQQRASILMAERFG